MKKFILLFTVMLTTVSFAQIKKVDTTTSSGEVIGKIEPFGQSLEMECTKNGNVYNFRYLDHQYSTLKEYANFSFEDVDNSFEDFYKMTIELFETKPKESVMLEVKDYYIWVAYKKTMGIASVSFKSSLKTVGAPISYTKEFNKKQIEKLFGKNK
ncbi:hypothetical protein FMM05_12580 [Flavobacterium zepuense]|uniref:Uncharacterized protein n=1 Tax=Flavobacterium zepuense TaxID=2593302 RepID=A0A552V0I7_9FLAO|nr:hypothetical protein [Flavobacterium zepuense]TRW23987.1 hypothetical protein FMM05_12580 [Flavobacterium zepuense]